MRSLKIVVVLLFAVSGLAGCGLLGHDGRSADQEIQQILDDDAMFTVLLRQDATDAQRTRAEAALRALPGFTGIKLIDRDTAYARMKQAYSAQPSFFDKIQPENFPESFEVRMKDITAVRSLRDDDRAVRDLPGVDRVVFPCTTPVECRQKYQPKPTAPPS